MTADEFAKALNQIGYQPTAAQRRWLEAYVVSPTRRQRFARCLRAGLAFCEQLGAAAIALPSTAPQFARELWDELRMSGPTPAKFALLRGFTAGMFLLSIGLFAAAASR